MSSVPFVEMLGIEEVALDAGSATLVMEVGQKLHNRRGVAHGGAIATVLDTAMARAARTLEDDIELGGTVDLNVKYLAPGSGRLTTIGRVMHATQSLAFCQGETRDADDALIAIGSATISLRRKRRHDG